MAQQANLQVATRTDTGKGAARSAPPRRARSPASSTATTGPPEALDRGHRRRSTRCSSASAPRTTIVDVTVDDRAPVKALIREIQRDSLRPGADRPPRPLRDPRRREDHRSRCRSTWSAPPTACATSAACSTSRCASSRSRCCRPTSPSTIELDVTALDHRPLAASCATSASPRPRSSTIPTRRSAPWWRRATEEAPSPSSRRPRRPSRSSSGSRRPRTRARAKEPRSQAEGLSPARHRGAGQPRPGVRRDPAQRRVSAGRPPRRPLAARAASAAATAPGSPRARWHGHARPLAQAPDVHEPERRGARRRSATCPSSIPAATCSFWSTTWPCRLGRFRLRGAGSAGGHNGLKSIEGALQRQDYARLRIGVGPAPAGLDDLADYVLAPFDPRGARDSRRAARPDGRGGRELARRRGSSAP